MVKWVLRNPELEGQYKGLKQELECFQGSRKHSFHLPSVQKPSASLGRHDYPSECRLLCTADSGFQPPRRLTRMPLTPNFRLLCQSAVAQSSDADPGGMFGMMVFNDGRLETLQVCTYSKTFYSAGSPQACKSLRHFWSLLLWPLTA